MSIQYVRVCHGLVDFGKLVPREDLYEHIDNPNKDWYRSVYYYNQEQYNQFKETGSVAGITDVTTDNIVFDFDSEDLEMAKSDTIETVSRLVSHGINPDDFTVCYSGQKGFSIEMQTTSTFTPKELKCLAKAIAGDLQTFDTKVYNANRIFRIPKTRHNISGLFKIPLTVNQLSDLTVADIKRLAKSPDNSAEWSVSVVRLAPELVNLSKVEKEYEKPKAVPMGEIDLSQKPKWLSACKYAILQGNFKPGNRSHALMALGATIASQGFPKEVTYRMLKGAAELQSQRTGQEPFAKEEIWNNIIKVIYSPSWKGATYSCKDHEFLQDICPAKGTNKCGLNKKESVITIGSVSDSFASYAKNIDKNTIKTGIPSLDKNIRLMTSGHYVIAGCSGSGKTSLMLNILKNISGQGLTGLFGCADMSNQMIYQKIAQQVSNYTDDELYDIYKNDLKDRRKEIDTAITDQYGKVLFDFRRGPSIEEVREVVLATKEKHPDDFKLFVFDYIAKIGGPYSDETANLAHIAPKLADIADEAEVCVISLAQVARTKGGPNTPFKDSRIAKGSGAIEESATAVLGLWRPGYNTEEDNFITVAGLKMRMGKEFRVDLGWEGATSRIFEMNDYQKAELQQLRDRLDEENKENSW